MARKIFLLLSTLLLAGTAAIAADRENAEINYLLTTIGSSDCQFIRNGKEHSPLEAADHLGMKYSRAKKHIKSAEDFIDNLASASSWTGKAYEIRCPESAGELSSDWLYQRLQSYRSEQIAE
jgi:hypothetical protein